MADEDIDKVQSLLNGGADPNHKIFWSANWISKNYPPLHTACIKGNLEVVQVLILKGQADAGKGDFTFNLTPLQHACLEGNKQVVEYLTKEVKCKIGK